jgi:hypothetical protein
MIRPPEAAVEGRCTDQARPHAKSSAHSPATYSKRVGNGASKRRARADIAGSLSEGTVNLRLLNSVTSSYHASRIQALLTQFFRGSRS